MSIYKFKQDNHAFTLLELLMVILVIASLAALFLPQLQDFKEKARAAEAINILEAIKQGELLYRAETGTFVSVNSQQSIMEKLRVEIPSTTSPTALWDYMVSGTTTNCFSAVARRKSYLAGSHFNKYILLDYSDVWGTQIYGTHPGAPAREPEFGRW